MTVMVFKLGRRNGLRPGLVLNDFSEGGYMNYLRYVITMTSQWGDIRTNMDTEVWRHWGVFELVVTVTSCDWLLPITVAHFKAKFFSRLFRNCTIMLIFDQQSNLSSLFFLWTIPGLIFGRC